MYGCRLEGFRHHKMCWQSALGTAVAKVDRPALTAYYRAKFGGGNATIQIAQK